MLFSMAHFAVQMQGTCTLAKSFPQFFQRQNFTHERLIRVDELHQIRLHASFSNRGPARRWLEKRTIGALHVGPIRGENIDENIGLEDAKTGVKGFRHFGMKTASQIIEKVERETQQRVHVPNFDWIFGQDDDVIIPDNGFSAASTLIPHGDGAFLIRNKNDVTSSIAEERLLA